MSRKSRLSGRMVPFLFLAAAPVAARAADIQPGYELLQSISGTTFAGAPFVGVPLGSFNFGGSIGTKSVGNADTIVQRLGPSVVTMPPGDSTIPIQLLALQLESASPINLGGGTNFYFLTLQSARGGPASTGSMTDHFTNNSVGTFNSSLDVFFDIRVGSLNGPIIQSNDLIETLSGDTWSRNPIPGAVTIPGVNVNLNGVNNGSDFWPDVPFSQTFPTGAIQTVTDATVPVPLPAAAWQGAGLLGVLGTTQIIRRRRSASDATTGTA